MKYALYRIIFCLALSFSLLSPPQGPEVSSDEVSLDEETRILCRQVLMAIYQDIFALKSQFEELKDFDEYVLSENQYGLPLIQYRYPASSEESSQGNPYEFGITIASMNDTYFNEYGYDSFNLAFPVLGLKFTGYQRKTFRAQQFDIQGVMQRRGQVLWDHQQEFMPYRLSLKTVKDEYNLGEPIDFTVTLTNFSKKNIRVKDLTNNTMFFLYDNKSWGAKEVNPTRSIREKEIILKPNESISKSFSGYSFSNPKEFEIYCSYILTYQGVKPSAALRVKVVK